MATSKSVKKKARNLFEIQNMSIASVARSIGVHSNTVAGWKKAEGWMRPDEASAAYSVPVTNAYHVGESVPQVTVWDDSFMTGPIDEDEPDTSNGPEAFASPVEEEALRVRIAELEGQISRLDAENQVLRPTQDISGYLEDRVKWLSTHTPEGEDYWLNRAEAEFKRENRQRAKDGLPVFDVKDHPELLDELVNTLKTAEAAALAKEPDEPPRRRIKMFIMRNGMPTIEQIPYENHINNVAGSLADGIFRYTQKGFKLTSPFLCPRAGCFRPAAVDGFNHWQFGGYCSERHYTEVEGQKATPIPGVITADIGRAYAGG